jgi:hypothetical protein
LHGVGHASQPPTDAIRTYFKVLRFTSGDEAVTSTVSTFPSALTE